MTTNTYNGWTNYETWLINLHFDGFFEPNTEAEEIESSVYEICEEQITNNDGGIVFDIVNAFLADVNWREIAEHYEEKDDNEEWCINSLSFFSTYSYSFSLYLSPS